MNKFGRKWIFHLWSSTSAIFLTMRCNLHGKLCSKDKVNIYHGRPIFIQYMGQWDLALLFIILSNYNLFSLKHHLTPTVFFHFLFHIMQWFLTIRIQKSDPSLFPSSTIIAKWSWTSMVAATTSWFVSNWGTNSTFACASFAL